MGLQGFYALRQLRVASLQGRHVSSHGSSGCCNSSGRVRVNMYVFPNFSASRERQRSRLCTQAAARELAKLALAPAAAFHVKTNVAPRGGAGAGSETTGSLEAAARQAAARQSTRFISLLTLAEEAAAAAPLAHDELLLQRGLRGKAATSEHPEPAAATAVATAPEAAEYLHAAESSEQALNSNIAAVAFCYSCLSPWLWSRHQVTASNRNCSRHLAAAVRRYLCVLNLGGTRSTRFPPQQSLTGTAVAAVCDAASTAAGAQAPVRLHVVAGPASPLQELQALPKPEQQYYRKEQQQCHPMRCYSAAAAAAEVSRPLRWSSTRSSNSSMPAITRPCSSPNVNQQPALQRLLQQEYSSDVHASQRMQRSSGAAAAAGFHTYGASHFSQHSPFTPPRHATTILCVRKGNQVCVAGDGMVSQGQMIVKPNARKVRRLQEGVVCGFAGATADCFTLVEKLESKLDEYPGQLLRACVELAKQWRTDRYLRHLEAVLIVADKKMSLEVSGVGDVLESHDGILGVGSGGPYAVAAARALFDVDNLSAHAICMRSMAIAASMCCHTNDQVVFELLNNEREKRPLQAAVQSTQDNYRAAGSDVSADKRKND